MVTLFLLYLYGASMGDLECKGFGGSTKRSVVKKVMSNLKPGVLLLQETKLIC